MSPFYDEQIRVNIGEAYLIAPIETLEHVVNVYKSLAEESDDPKPWLAVANQMQNWIDETGFFPEDYEGDELEELYEEDEIIE